MRKRIFNQPIQAAQTQVEAIGGASTYYFNSASTDTVTPTNHTFNIRPSHWPYPTKACNFFGDATLNGRFALGTMDTRFNEINVTQDYTTMNIYDPVTHVLQVIQIPTTTGILQPPSSNGYSTGSPLDTVRAVRIGSDNYVFGVVPTEYQNWRIATYGVPYCIVAAKQQSDGSYAFDATHSYTAADLHNSSAAGAACFPSATNIYGETYYRSLGMVPMVVGPQSNHLIVGQYFYRTGSHSGAIIAIDPSNGTVLAYNQLPDVTALDSTDLSISIRDMAISPVSTVNDERFIVTPDTFVRTGGNYGNALMEFQYNAGAATITLLSPPTQPYTTPGLAYDFSYNLVAYDASGNLYCGVHGGTGLGVFAGHEMHVYKATGNSLPTLEGGGTVDISNYAIKSKADFRFGNFAVSNGYDESINWDNTNGRIVLVSLNAKAYAATIQSPFSLGSEILTNTDFTVNIDGWNAFFSSCTQARVVAADFPSGFALQTTSTADNVNNIVASSKFDVTAGQNYITTTLVEAVTTPRTAKYQFIWYNSVGTLFAATTGSTTPDAVGSTTYLEVVGVAPAGAVQGQVFLTFQNVALGEQHLVSSFSWKTEPAIAATTVDLNMAHIAGSGISKTNPLKGAIISGRLWLPLSQTSSVTTPPFPSNNQWLVNYDLTAHN